MPHSLRSRAWLNSFFWTDKKIRKRKNHLHDVPSFFNKGNSVVDNFVSGRSERAIEVPMKNRVIEMFNVTREKMRIANVVKVSPRIFALVVTSASAPLEDKCWTFFSLSRCRMTQRKREKSSTPHSGRVKATTTIVRAEEEEKEIRHIVRVTCPPCIRIRLLDEIEFTLLLFS